MNGTAPPSGANELYFTSVENQWKLGTDLMDAPPIRAKLLRAVVAAVPTPGGCLLLLRAPSRLELSDRKLSTSWAFTWPDPARLHSEAGRCISPSRRSIADSSAALSTLAGHLC